MICGVASLLFILVSCQDGGAILLVCGFEGV
jgi:hypothetical protein